VHRSWLEWASGAISGARALETVRGLTRFHRVQASPGLDEAAEWVAAELERAGLEVELERAPADGRTRWLGELMPQGWHCARASADLFDGDHRERLCDIDSEPLSLVLRSDSVRGRYRLVSVGEGIEDADYARRDVRGCVVLARGDVHRVHELAVLRRGASGLLTDFRRLAPPVRGADDETDAFNYTSFWWAGDEPRGWGFVVPPRVGDRLRRRLADGAGLELEVTIESRAFDTTLPLLSGVLRGGGAGEILVVSHLCHPRPSANDNASGVAANLEAARALAARFARQDPPRRSLRFLFVPELSGTCAFLGGDPARAPRIQAALNLDMVGESQERCGSTFLLEHPPHWSGSFAEPLLARIRAESVEWVTSYSGPGHYSMTRMAEVPYSGGSDHAVFVDPSIGVPCPMLIQWPDRFYHSSHDTPDQCDPDSLALAARCASSYAGWLATAAAEETAWLAELVARDARRRALAALERPDGMREIERETVRGARALASLARLDVDAEWISGAQDRFHEFVRRELGLEPATPGSGGDARRPRRILNGPLGFPRRLLPGWVGLPLEARESWRRRELETPDAFLVSELSWLACDGTRTIAEIERMVWLETGARGEGFVAAFFDLAARLGIASW
jgi:hypothetical protein